MDIPVTKTHNGTHWEKESGFEPQEIVKVFSAMYERVRKAVASGTPITWIGFNVGSGEKKQSELVVLNHKRLIVAFDVDDTLIVPSVATGFDRDVPNYDTIALFRWFQAQGHRMIIWSGSGVDWAKTWAEKLGLDAEIRRKGDCEVDIAFDDCDVKLGRINVKVKRLNNNISREDWNKKPRV